MSRGSLFHWFDCVPCVRVGQTGELCKTVELIEILFGGLTQREFKEPDIRKGFRCLTGKGTFEG